MQSAPAEVLPCKYRFSPHARRGDPHALGVPVCIPRTGGVAACPEESEESPANSSAAPATFHGYGRIRRMMALRRHPTAKQSKIL
ncbi:MAG: hypothetical protein LBI69_02085 [Puniceicoccales bacterium]|nr:hypothetical protein [Puniceicoccales bacterium]